MGDAFEGGWIKGWCCSCEVGGVQVDDADDDGCLKGGRSAGDVGGGEVVGGCCIRDGEFCPGDLSIDLVVLQGCDVKAEAEIGVVGDGICLGTG